MDGANMITQCPIQPGYNFTYRFDITGQEGTLLWHAHVVNLRATLHGAIIIRPRSGRPYPFPKPYKEVPIIFGKHCHFIFVTEVKGKMDSLTLTIVNKYI